MSNDTVTLADLTDFAIKMAFRPQVGYIAAHSGAEIREFVRDAVKVSVAFRDGVPVEAIRVHRDTVGVSGLSNFRVTEDEDPMTWAMTWIAWAPR